MPHRLDRKGPAHQHPHVHGFRQLRLGSIQVEDLLDSVLDSVEAILGDGDGECHQFLVLLAECTVREYLGAELAVAAKDAPRSSQDPGVKLILASLSISQISHFLPPFAGGSEGKNFEPHACLARTAGVLTTRAFHEDSLSVYYAAEQYRTSCRPSWIFLAPEREAVA